jgi:hypothetical protein
MGSAAYNRGSQSIRRQINEENQQRQLPRLAEIELFYKDKFKELELIVVQKDADIINLQQDKADQQRKIQELENELKSNIERKQLSSKDKAELKRRWLLVSAILRYVLCFSPERIEELKLDAYEVFPHLKR